MHSRCVERYVFQQVQDVLPFFNHAEDLPRRTTGRRMYLGFQMFIEAVR